MGALLGFSVLIGAVGLLLFVALVFVGMAGFAAAVPGAAKEVGGIIADIFKSNRKHD